MCIGIPWYKITAATITLDPARAKTSIRSFIRSVLNITVKEVLLTPKSVRQT